jgi:putative ABC transport system permease protein
MNFRDFRIGLRLLVKEPGYSAIVVLGLTVGFAVCFLLLMFVRYSFSYDSFVPDAQRIYLVKHKLNIIGKPAWYESTPLPFLDVAQRSGLIESSSAIIALPLSLKVGTLVQSVELTAVQPSFQAMFNIVPIAGDLGKALSRPDMLALTRTTANQLFGDDNVVGKTVQIGGKSFLVAALLPDAPSNSTVSYAGLVGIDTAAWPAEERNFLFHSWGNIGAKLYVKLKRDASASNLVQVLQDASDHSPLISELGPEVLQQLGNKKVMEIRLGALSDAYFERDTANAPMSSQHGDLRVVLGLSSVAALILLLAAVNYVNLATVRTVQRQREIAVRKVLGAGVGRLIGQFLAESVVVALLATGLGLVLAAALIPLFSELVDRKLEHMFTPTAILLSVGLGLVLGVAAGIYPAWVALRVRPPRTLSGRGSSETAGGLWMRRTLSVLQFATAIGLVGVTLTIAYQTRFAMQANPGFDARPLLVVSLPSDLKTAASRSYREALSRVADVDGVAAADNPVGRSVVGQNFDVARSDGTKTSVVARPVSPNFFEVYGVQALAGRMFDSKRDSDDQGDVVVINAAAMRALHYTSAAATVGQMVTLGDGAEARVARIVGVAPDIRHEGLHDEPQPLAYYPNLAISVLTVRTHGNMLALEEKARELQRQYFPDSVVEIRTAASYFAQNYTDDLRLAKLLGMASCIAIAIAAFGIYVLAAYSVQRREREIVLRKLHGAGPRNIAVLIGAEFGVLVGTGAVLALPLAWLVSERYLSTFVERAPMATLPLAFACALLILVAIATTLGHTVKATRLSPARAFRGA